MSSDEGHPQVSNTVEIAAIRSEVSNAFSMEDDSDGEQFDIDSFRARRQAELEATAEPEPDESYMEQAQSPKYIIRNSADLVVQEAAVTSQPVSPFAVAYNGTDSEPPLSAKLHSASLEDQPKEYQNPEPHSPYPHVRTTSINEQDEGVEVDMPSQSFEDISLEGDVGEEGVATPNSARTPGSGFGDTHSPRSAGFSTHQQASSAAAATSHPLPVSNPVPPSGATDVSGQAFDAQFKRSKKAGGRSALQKMVSRTRPTHLPPKPKEEDVKHLKVWEEMMKKSRYAEEKRRQELKRRREAHEKEVEESIPRWQQEIVPDWRRVMREPALRALWWRGIPPKLRGQLWEKAVGNPLQMGKDAFKSCLARGQRAIARGTFPQESLDQMEADMDSTLPALHLFHRESGVMRQDLQELMIAWTVARSDEALGYTMGAARIGAMLLINIPLPHTFLTMRNLLERHCLRSLYGGPAVKQDVEAYYRIFDTLLADSLPKVYFNFKQHHISPVEYLPDWLIPMFMDHLPFEACARLWDIIVLEGDSFLFRAALAIFGVLEARLFFPDRGELMQVLRGESKAAAEVAKRAAGGAAEIIDLGARYEVYGLDEGTLWERIEASEEWWRESTWSRLIQRELPDI